MSETLLFFQHFVALFIESAPWLLFGLFIAGVMHELVPVDILKKHMGSSSLGSISKAAIIGAPLPLCSCGVIPAALGLRRSGASKSSTISFLVSTPETGVDSVSVSYALLGPVFAVVRPIAAILSAIFAGVLVKVFGADDSAGETSAIKQDISCCSHEAKTACPSENGLSKQGADLTQADCASDSVSTAAWYTKISKLVSFAAGKLLADITLWLLLGLAMAALIKTFVPTDFLTSWGDGFIAMLVMVLIGIPMYICATASTPIALGFLVAGLSPGAVLVFMLAGPATNVSTMGMIGKEMGKRTLAIYLLAVVSAAIAFGYALNILWAQMQWSLPTSAIDAHGHSATQWIYYACAILMAVLMARNVIKSMVKNSSSKHSASAENPMSSNQSSSH